VDLSIFKDLSNLSSIFSIA